MLQAVANVAPRGVYVCGNTATTSGLTVTLVKEGGTGEYSLEAGALVLGDQGFFLLSITLFIAFSPYLILWFSSSSFCVHDSQLSFLLMYVMLHSVHIYPFDV